MIKVAEMTNLMFINTENRIISNFVLTHRVKHRKEQGSAGYNLVEDDVGV